MGSFCLFWIVLWVVLFFLLWCSNRIVVFGCGCCISGIGLVWWCVWLVCCCLWWLVWFLIMLWRLRLNFRCRISIWNCWLICLDSLVCVKMVMCWFCVWFGNGWICSWVLLLVDVWLSGWLRRFICCCYVLVVMFGWVLIVRLVWWSMNWFCVVWFFILMICIRVVM